jgi:hypothetical protein
MYHTVANSLWYKRYDHTTSACYISNLNYVIIFLYRIVNFRLHHLIQNLNPICCWCVFIRCMCISFSISNFATNLQLPFLVTLMEIIYDRFYIPLCILHTGWCGLAHPTTLSSLRAFIGGKNWKRLLILDVQKKSHQILLPISCSC